ncbi:aminotransferase class IV [Streptomyces sp. NPDC096193]|uniref:aminotransferase class IV n=1 Tax=Streptomyces sp. NPDC096193 TaxID=3155821 RepID=UPI00332840E1
MTRTETTYTEIDGMPATESALSAPVLSGPGHFTAMQVRDGRVRGLALHLDRLDAATREYLGRTGLDGERVRAEIRQALAASGRDDASVRVHVHWPDGDSRATLKVTVRGPQVAATGPLRLISVPYVRHTPRIKHLDGAVQNRALDEAEARGADEALLTTPEGLVTEGAITNIAFWDGEHVIWPDAPCLRGMTMALLEPRLPSVRRVVTLGDLPGCRAVFVTNSRGISPVGRVDDVEFPVAQDFMTGVMAAYEAVPWDVV